MTSATVLTDHWQAAPSIDIGPFVYRREDYVGTIRHLVIIAVDLAVIVFVVLPLGMIPAVVADSMSIRSDLFLFCPLLLTWLYLTVLKPSRIRSLGYWVTGSKIVTIYGEKPSTIRMTIRLAATILWIAVPPSGMFFVDLMWPTVDEERQTLRDLYCGTRIIRNRATPVAQGKIVYSFYTAMNYSLMYASVQKDAKVATLHSLSEDAKSKQ